MQGTCDHHSHFLDVDMSHHGSTSDYLAFETSDLKRDLEHPGFLAPGLCVFGNAAHSNGFCMATPFKNAKSGSEDDFNFCHSHVRIEIGCAFGMFINRWNVLRKALPLQLSLKKIGSLVLCLCRLHNFCIGQRLEQNGQSEDDFTQDSA